ncbi:MAG: hypothetical protein WB341_01480, partial [Terracidiphilus sp.]
GGGDSGRAADAGQGGRGDGRDRRVALSAQASRMYSPQVLDHFALVEILHYEQSAVSAKTLPDLYTLWNQ